MGVASQGAALNQTPNTIWTRIGSETHTAKRVRSKGKQPRLSSKVSKYHLSVEGSVIPQTARRLAQKQPSFKESVTAHWSIVEFGAENEPRLKHSAEDIDFIHPPGCMIW